MESFYKRTLLQAAETVPLGYSYETGDHNKDLQHALITGLGPVIVAFLWLLLGLALLAMYLLRWRKGRSHIQKEYERATTNRKRVANPLLWPLLGLGLLFSIVGIGCAFGANPKLYKTFKHTRNTAYQAADNVVVAGASTGAQLRTTSAVLRATPPQFAALLGNTLPPTLPASLDAEATTVVYVTQHASDNMYDYLRPAADISKAIYITVFIILALAILLLLLTLAGIATSSVLLLSIVLVLLWLLTLWVWVWVGAGVVQHNAFNTICTDAQKILTNQSDQSSELSRILPCAALVPARPTAIAGKQLTGGVTLSVNRLLPTIGAVGAQSNVTATVPGPACAPFPQNPPANVSSALLTPAGCRPLNQTLPALGQYYAQVVANNPGAANLTGLTPAGLGNFGGAFLGLVGVTQTLEDLIFCRYLTGPMQTIVDRDCNSLKWASNFLWSSLLILGTGLMLMSLATIFALQKVRRQRLAREAAPTNLDGADVKGQVAQPPAGAV